VPPAPTIRRLPVPASEPPYDDERERGLPQTPLPGSGDCGVQGALALAFVLPNGLPATPCPPPDLQLVPARPDAEVDLDEIEFGPQPTPRAELPEPRGWAARLVQAVVEVLAGERPAAQLVRWTSADVYDALRAGTDTAPGTSRREPSRPLVRSVHVAEPVDGVAEVAALVRRGTRATAVALRLEGIDGRWQCTAIELG
jgi:hypothetical protein